jgi:acetyl esterase/lipase
MANKGDMNDNHANCPLHRRTFLAGAAASALAGCSSVGAFDIVAGRSFGSALAAEGVAFDTATGLKLDVWTPSGRGANALAPVILFVYGGSWESGSRSEYGFVGSALAALGYITVIADYRKRPAALFPAFMQDQAKALAWIGREATRFGGDPRRIGIVGHSAGAHIALLLALDRRYMRAEGVDPSTVKAVAGLSGPYDFFPWDSPISRATFDHWPRPAETQPVNYARPDAPPTFLAHGLADTTVKPANTTTLAAVLRRAGASVTLRTYDGVGHAGTLTALSANFRGSNPVHADLAAFLKRHLPA